jgi:hypothetical protein
MPIRLRQPRRDRLSMNNLHDIGTYLSHSTLLQMHSCTLAAAQLDAVIHSARSEMLAKAQEQPTLLRPDEDFAEMDAMIDEIFQAMSGPR